jgi:hypothetical protein
MNKIRPSQIAQRTVSLVNGPRKVVRNYSTIDPRTVARPVGIGAIHVHAAAIKASQARVITTASVIDGVVVDDTGIRPHSMAWVQSILKGEF